jgi:hypothetical protein
MTWGSVISAVGAIGGGLLASSGSRSAAGTSASADQAAIDEQRRQFDLTRGDTANYRNVGNQAINRLGQIYGYNTGPSSQPLSFEQWMAQNPSGPSGGSGRPGDTFNWPSSRVQLPPGRSPIGIQPIGGDAQSRYQTYLQGFQPQGGTATAPDYSSFYASPDYNFRRTEGTRDIGNSFAARGGAASGNALKALADYNSSLAAGEFGNFFNRQAALAGIGQTATGQAASAGGAASANISNLLSRQGDARASGVAGSYDAYGNALNQLGGVIGDWWQNRKKTPSPVMGPPW